LGLSRHYKSDNLLIVIKSDRKEDMGDVLTGRRADQDLNDFESDLWLHERINY